MLAATRAFFELGKFKIVELWLGFFVGASFLGRRAVEDSRAVAILVLILALGILVIGATCSLDDIAGARDGVDRANQHDAAGGARWGVSKPLLTGKLGEGQALKFVHVVGVVGVLAYGVVLALAWPLPAWFLVTMTAVMVVALNYSYGLKLSYRGAGELVIFLGGAGTVLVPYVLVARSVEPAVLVCAGLVGAWHAQVVMFSNTKDARGDRATGRMTIAARTSERGNRVYIASAFALCWALTGLAFALRLIPSAYAFALLPVWAMQTVQLWSGVGRGEWLSARLVGFRVLRVGITALTLVTVALTSLSA